jgi:hypothetical protein
VADDQDRRALVVGEPAQQAHRLLTALRVEVGGRLVREDQLRAVGDRARDGDARLRAARKLIGGEVEAGADAELIKQPPSASVGLAAAAAGEIQGDLNVLFRRERGQQVEVLEDEAEAVRAEARQLLFAELPSASGRHRLITAYPIGVITDFSRRRRGDVSRRL